MKREFDRRIWRSGNSYVVTIPSETVERFELQGKFITVTILADIINRSKEKLRKKVRRKK